MSEPHVWVEGEKITSAKLNDLENRIANPESTEMRILEIDEQRYIDLTPAQLDADLAVGKMNRLKDPSQEGDQYLYPDLKLVSYWKDLKDIKSTVLIDTAVSITSDLSYDNYNFALIQQVADRSNWIVTVTHNNVTAQLSMNYDEDSGNTYTYTGLVDNIQCTVTDTSTAFSFISEGSVNASIFFLAAQDGSYTVSITKADGITIVAPEQIAVVDNGNATILTTAAAGYIIPYMFDMSQSLPYDAHLTLQVDGEVFYNSNYDNITTRFYNTDWTKVCIFDTLYNAVIICTNDPADWIIGDVIPGDYDIKLTINYSYNLPQPEETQNYTYLPIVSVVSGHYECEFESYAQSSYSFTTYQANTKFKFN